MTKIPSYKNKRDNVIVIVIVLLIISIVITNSFIIFSPDEDSRFYFSGLTSSLTLAAALVISIVMVYRYKRSIKKQKEMQQAISNRNDDTNPITIIMIITKSISLFVYFLHSG
jgi:membrane protein implicated in regulation of membrane protease activity